MKISKKIVLLLSIFNFQFSISAETLGMRELGDSLMAYTGFSSVWSPRVRVNNMRINGKQVTIKTNATLRDFRWTPENVAEIKRKVSLWTLGEPDGKVTIYSAGTDIETLITACAKTQAPTTKCNISSDRYCDLTDKTLVLYPSHGMFYHRGRDEWIWQRATLWTTVEDLYSMEYVRVIKRMLENAGATVLMPRADLDQHDIGVSGMPQWAEGARYWLESQGVDSALWNLYDGNEYKDDMKCRAMWVNAQDAPIDLCVALHTDGLDSGDDSTIIGTLVIYTAHDDDGKSTLRDGRDRETTNRNLGDWIQTQITEDLRHIAPEWTRRQLREANYCESRVPVVPSIILELLSHKNMADMKYGLDPAFRFAASRAVYKGILRYLNGRDATVQPLPVRQLAIDQTGLLQWQAPVDTLEPSAEPLYYMVYVQENDGEWDVQQVDQGTRLQLTLTPGVRYNYYVVAGNDGGLSFPSPVISAYMSNSPKDDLTGEAGQTAKRSNSEAVLIIDAFDDVYGPEWFADSTFAGIVPGSYACEDHFSCAYLGQQWDYNRSHKWINDDNCGWGACDRDHAGQLTIGNTRDWAAQHGRVLQKMKISYISSTAGMVNEPYGEADRMNEVNKEMSNAKCQMPNVIDIICGRQRNPLPDSLRAQIGAFISQGGKVLLSTDHFSAIDPQWAKQKLHTSFYAAHATRSGRISFEATGEAGAMINRRSRSNYKLFLEPNEMQLFTCHPEGLKPEKGAVRMAEYRDMRCTAAVGYTHPQSGSKTLVFGFPLEAVINFETLYRFSIDWLLDK